MSFEKYGLNLYAILFLKRKILHKYACVKVCEETFPLWDRKSFTPRHITNKATVYLFLHLGITATIIAHAKVQSF